VSPASITDKNSAPLKHGGPRAAIPAGRPNQRVAFQQSEQLLYQGDRLGEDENHP